MEIKYTTIDEYIKTFSENIQEILKEIRQIINVVVPNGEECVRYGLATIRINNKNLVHFGGFKGHIGLYPTPSAIQKFKKELEKYESGKGSIKFPLNQKIPYALIQKIVEYRKLECA